MRDRCEIGAVMFAGDGGAGVAFDAGRARFRGRLVDGANHGSNDENDAGRHVLKEPVECLFDPASVRLVLAEFPALARELKPYVEGEKAERFERVRKSPRQVYRVLGNAHYKLLTDLL